MPEQNFFFHDVPDIYLQKWQKLADILAEVLDVRAALIMRVHPSDIEVLVSSDSPYNSYTPQELAKLNTNLYCETVMRHRRPLEVVNSHQEELWKDNPDEINRQMISYVGFPLEWPDGQIFGTICALDNRARKHSRVHLKLLEQFKLIIETDFIFIISNEDIFNQFFNLMAVGFALVSSEGFFLRANKRFCQTLGYTEEELNSLSFKDITEGDVAETLREHFRSLLAGTTSSFCMERNYIKKNGDRIWARLTATVITEYRDSSKKFFILVLDDITLRKIAEENLTSKFEHLKSLSRISADINKATDIKDILKRTASSCLEIFNCDRVIFLTPCDPEASSFQIPIEVCKPDFFVTFKLDTQIPMTPLQAAIMKKAMGSEMPINFYAEELEKLDFKHNLFHIQNSIWPKSCMISVLRPNTGDSWLFCMHQCSRERRWSLEEQHLFQQIQQRIVDALNIHTLHKELESSEKQYRLIFEETPDAIFLADSDTGIIIDANNAASNLVGIARDKLIGLHQSQLHPMELEHISRELFSSHLRDIISSKAIRPLEYVAQHSDGHHIPIEIIANPIEIGNKLILQAVFKDISKQKKDAKEKERLESKLRQSQRMEAMGTLAGGIAHDFNNILTPIMGYTEILMTKLPQENSNWYHLEAIIQAANRAKELVKQILAFSHQTEHERIPVDLSIIVKETIKLLRASIPTTIAIQKNIAERCGLMMADPTQLHQIVMNLCTNAYYSMRETGGILTISLSPVTTIDDKAIVFDLEHSKGPFLKLTVSDTGTGMTRAVAEKIFEPYFTTKTKEDGSGLGLSIVLGIVKQLKGQISVSSHPGEGSTFNVYLPYMVSDEKKVIADHLKPLPRGKENILIVDDEATIVDMEKTMLESLGYKVTQCTQSLEALNLFKSNPQQFDIILSDITMPLMTGVELAKKCLSIRPDMPIILCTGFSELIDEEESKRIGISEYLMKPLVKNKLAEALRRALTKNE